MIKFKRGVRLLRRNITGKYNKLIEQPQSQQQSNSKQSDSSECQGGLFPLENDNVVINDSKGDGEEDSSSTDLIGGQIVAFTMEDESGNILSNKLKFQPKGNSNIIVKELNKKARKEQELREKEKIFVVDTEPEIESQISECPSEINYESILIKKKSKETMIPEVLLRQKSFDKLISRQLKSTNKSVNFLIQLKAASFFNEESFNQLNKVDARILKNILSKLLQNKSKLKYIAKIINFITYKPQMVKNEHEETSLIIDKDKKGQINLFRLFGGIKNILKLQKANIFLEKLCLKYNINKENLLRNPASLDRVLTRKVSFLMEKVSNIQKESIRRIKSLTVKKNKNSKWKKSTDATSSQQWIDRLLRHRIQQNTSQNANFFQTFTTSFNKANYLSHRFKNQQASKKLHNQTISNFQLFKNPNKEQESQQQQQLFTATYSKQSSHGMSRQMSRILDSQNGTNEKKNSFMVFDLKAFQKKNQSKKFIRARKSGPHFNLSKVLVNKLPQLDRKTKRKSFYK